MPLKPLKMAGFGEKHAFFFEDKEVAMPKRRPSTASIQHTMFWTSKRIGLVLIVAFLTIGAAIGTGVGVALHKVSQKSRVVGVHSNSTSTDPGSGIHSNTSTYSNTSISTGTGTSGGPASLWSPKAGLTWNMQFVNAIDTSSYYDVWDIDLFDTDVSIISTLQKKGSKVICYFSGGSCENWRPDAANFQPQDLGLDLSGWPGEKWINVSSPSVRSIMLKRLDLAASKGCDGVDPDNMDAYNNKNGLGLTQQDAINYVTFLSGAARSRNLAISLKNAGEIVSSVVDHVQYSVNEACAQYSECKTFQPFIQAGKPVFHVEYPKGGSTNNYKDVSSNQATKACSAGGLSGFSTIIKNSNLNDFIQLC